MARIIEDEMEEAVEDEEVVAEDEVAAMEGGAVEDEVDAMEGAVEADVEAEGVVSMSWTSRRFPLFEAKRTPPPKMHTHSSLGYQLTQGIKIPMQLFKYLHEKNCNQCWHW